MNTMCGVSLAKHLRAADVFPPFRVEHIVFIHILSAVKPVHIFMVWNRVAKNSLIAELCFHRFDII